MTFHSVLVTGDAAGNVVTTVDLGATYCALCAAGRPHDTCQETATPIRITAVKARRLLREVVAEVGRGHRAALVGVYVDDGCPICIGAHVLHRAGVTVAELAAMDVVEGPLSIDLATVPARVRITSAARLVLHIAQDSSDWRNTWGEALDEALAVRPYRREQLAGAA